MGGGNGAKAAQKRERNLKNAGKPAQSQLKANAAALNIQCNVCKQTFMNTTKAPALKDHVESKHAGKSTFEQCFPVQAAAA